MISACEDSRSEVLESPVKSEGPQTKTFLLNQLKHEHDGDAWRQFYAIYGALLSRIVTSCGVPPADVDDVVQATVVSAAVAIKTFNYDPTVGKFRNWLWLIARRRIADYFREQGQIRRSINAAMVAGLELDPAIQDFDVKWDEEMRSYLLQEAGSAVQLQKAEEFLIYQFYVVKEWPIRDVANHFHVTERHVHYVTDLIAGMLRTKIEKSINRIASGDRSFP